MPPIPTTPAPRPPTAPLPRAAAIIASAAAHLAIVIAGFFVGWIVTLPEPPKPEPIVSFFDPALALNPAASLAPEPSNEPPPTTAAAIANTAAIPPIPPAPEPPIRDTLLLTPSIEPTLPMPAPAVAPSALALERRAGEARFLGVRSANAESIVYVVDATGSMLTTFPIVTRELLASIERLSPVQRFQIVFFAGTGTTFLPHPDIDPTLRALRILRATTANRRAAAEWLETLTPAGRATPLEALGLALQLEPDAIFLLSSGDNAARDPADAERETRAILGHLETLNPIDPRTDRRRTPIKVIQFLSPDQSGLLQAIADEHGGRDGFTFITREQLGLH